MVLEFTNEEDFQREFAKNFVGAQEAPNEDGLTKLRRIASLVLAQQDAVSRCEAELAAAKGYLATLVQEVLPALLDEFKMLESPVFTTEDGKRMQVKLGDKYYPSINCSHRHRPGDSACQSCREIAYEWLKDQGHGGVIKHNVEVPVGLRDEEFVKGLVDRILAVDPTLEVGDTRKIEPATFARVVKSLLEGDVQMPDSINPNRRREAKVVTS